MKVRARPCQVAAAPAIGSFAAHALPDHGGGFGGQLVARTLGDRVEPLAAIATATTLAATHRRNLSKIRAGARDARPRSVDDGASATSAPARLALTRGHRFGSG